jgi:hypothetical protein
LLFAALSWLFYEIFVPRLGEPILIWILSATFFPIELAVVIIYTIRRNRRILSGLSPRPQLGSPDSVILEWQNKLYDKMSNNYFRDFISFLLIMLGIIIVWVALIVVIAHYL